MEDRTEGARGWFRWFGISEVFGPGRSPKCATCYLNLSLHPKTPVFPNNTKVLLVPHHLFPKEVVALNVSLDLVLL